MTLGDSASNVGSLRSAPCGSKSFATVESKSHVQEGRAVICAARLEHGGRTTHVPDARIANEISQGAAVLFRSTQLVLYPRA